jgi:arginase
MGPFALRYAELARHLEDLGCQVTDQGNLKVPGPEQERSGQADGLRHLPAVAQINWMLADFVRHSLAEGALPITLGGDHSLAAGSAAGARAEGPVGLLWIDAHADFNTPDSSPSGNLHGMPLGALLGQEPTELAPYLNEGRILPEDVVIVGLRSVDPEERELVRAKKVRAFTMSDIDKQGMAEVVRQIREHFTWRNLSRIHISFDADSLDPVIAPGVGTPVPGGLSYREAHLMMEMLAQDGRVGSVDLVEINPILDDRNHTASLCVDLLASLLGRRIL